MADAKKAEAKYQRELEKRRARSKAGIDLGADIGPLPRVANPVRRENCRMDLHLFLTTYFPDTTGVWPFPPDLVRAIKRQESCILNGGRFVELVFRGAGKSTRAENATLWCMLYGHRMFPVLFGADAKAAEQNVSSIKFELENNERLGEDFPEVCMPIRALEGKPQRARFQLYQPGNVDGWEGDREGATHTHVEWTSDKIALPYVMVPEGFTSVEGPQPGAKLVPSASAGCAVVIKGITASVRGLKHKRPDGKQQRPDFVLIDDPQTEDSAATALQVNKRMDTIKKSILRLGGHAGKIAVFIEATCIQPNDLADQFADHLRNPSWQSERIPMVRKPPDALKTLWLVDYARIRRDYDPDIVDDQRRAHGAAREFYTSHRAEMDAGCEVTWPQCFDPDNELSAIQHAYDIWIDDGEDVFQSECQNQPMAKVDGDTDFSPIPRLEMLQRLNNLPVAIVPLRCQHVTAFVDVQHSCLFYLVLAAADDFTGSVISYGCYPDPHRPVFAVRDIQYTLQDEAKTTTIEAAVRAGLTTLTTALMQRDWRREDGVNMRAELCLVDSGDLTETVNEFCRTSAFAGSLMPSRGFGITAGKSPMEDKKIDATMRRGPGWIIRPTANKATRYVQIDVNHWKTTFHQRMHTKVGDPSALTLYGQSHAVDHRMLVDHFSSEYCNKTEGLGRTVYEWSLRPNAENHYLDCVVGAMVAASIRGCKLNARPPVQAKPNYIKMSEILARRTG